MQFEVTFKTPDAVRDSAGEAARATAHRRCAATMGEYSHEVYDDEKNEIWDQAIAFTKKWVKYGEYVTILFDTEAGTATVVPVGK